MKLTILNLKGVHQREVKGLSALKKALPAHWYGYAAFELIGVDSGEIDLLICADDRLVVVEIKDWNGRIEDCGQIWRTSGREERSPVAVVKSKATKLASKLKAFLGPNTHLPLVDHCVLLTGEAPRSDLRADSQERTFELDYFKKIGGADTFRKSFPSRSYIEIPISELEPKLKEYFLGSRVRPMSCSYNGYKADNDPCYAHPKGIYSEYFAKKEGVKGFKALLRRWDFQRLGEMDASYFDQENFKTIALREETAIGYLKETKPELADRRMFLNPITNEGRHSVSLNFFELYDLPPNLSRLKEALQKYGKGLNDESRISMARLLLSHFNELHDLEVTHRDIGEHCIWVSVPDKVALSGFSTCSFPEQSTVTQIRETIRAGAVQIPEDYFDQKSDNYRKDVFLLGIAVHQILMGKKPALDCDIPAWKEPEESKFKPFWGWFQRCLDFDPTKRFPDAKAAFQEFQRCDQKPVLDVDEDAFSEFKRLRLPLPMPDDLILREDNQRTVFRSTERDGEQRLIKVWPDARFEPGKAAANVHLLEFFQKIQNLQLKDFSGQQRILDFGMTRFGTFVSLKWEEGVSLGKYDFSNVSDDAALALIRSLFDTVVQMHRANYYHGDIKPENILVVEQGDELPSVCLVDVIDFAALGTERRSTAYQPPEGESATAPACDGYALRKVVTTFLFERMKLVSCEFKERISKILDEMQDPEGGVPNLGGALDALHSEEQEATQEEVDELVVEMAGIEEEEVLIYPDDRGLPVTIQPSRWDFRYFDLKITDPQKALTISYDPVKARIARGEIVPSSLTDFLWALKKQESSLQRPLRIRKGNIDDFSALHLYCKGAGLLDNLRPSDATEQFAEPSQVLDTNDTTGTGDGEGEEIVVSKLWEALLDAEADIVPVATIMDEPASIAHSNILIVSVGEFTAPFEPQFDDPVEVQTQIRDGEWKYFGDLDHNRTRPDQLAVAPRSKNNFSLKPGYKLRLVSKASQASYDKRNTAVQRILKGDSVCPDLIRYFSCERGLGLREARFTTHLDKLKKYGLNETQEAALKTALSAAPLSMIQGPPGTGKTKVLSAMVHYITTHYPTARILVVSQSHEAIDHATEQVVKRFKEHRGEPPLVRIGKQSSVSDHLISYHSESQQGVYRERFRLSISQRVAPMGKRLGLSEDFVQELVILRSRLRPLLRRFDLDAQDGTIDPEALRSLKTVCQRLDPDFEVESVPVASLFDALLQRLEVRHQETDRQAVGTLLKVIDLALEWVQILEAPGKLDHFFVRSRQIVTGTCVGVGRWNLGIEKERFDCVIIDEAARCGPGDLAVASQVGEQVVLFGDHKQLPPFLEKEVIDHVVDQLGYRRHLVERSDFERLFGSEYASITGRTLLTQYRMREPIGRLVSECFYPDSGGLKCGRESSSQCYSQLPASLERHVTWIDSGDGGEESMNFSFWNRHEIDKIMEVLGEIDADKALLKELAADANAEALPAAIGIIAAYKAQADAIKDRLWTSSLSSALKSTCKVGTVDSYQGKENPIVIFSAVRCNRSDEIGFTRSWERVNVSISRARERLIIVGSWNFWSNLKQEAPLGRVAQFISDRVADADAGYSLNQFRTETE